MPKKPTPQPAQIEQQAEVKRHPGGRPTKYDPAMCDIVIASGKEGKTLAEMAADLEIHRETLNEWRKLHPEFSDALKFALLKSQAWWEERGRQGTFGGIQNFNATGFIFQMKNRFSDDYRDTIKQEVTGADGGPIRQQHEGAVAVNLRGLTDEELATLEKTLAKAVEGGEA